MEFFKKQTHIDFMRIRKYSWTFSLCLILVCLTSIFTRGINWGLDFTGGYQIQTHMQTTPNIAQVKSALTDIGLAHANVITFGSSKDLMITFSVKDLKQDISVLENTSHQEIQNTINSKVHQALPTATIVSLNYIGPQVGAELAQTGILAMVVAILAIMLYIALRFEIKFALSAALSLAHDPIVILGVFSILQLRFDLTALAAVLAVIGYSLNDIVVVYDRIRENFRELRKASITEVVNRAINDTLSRTIMTASLTFMVVLVLFLVGGPSIHYFALALMIGVVIGTYSSIYNAGGLAVLFGLNREAFIPKPKEVDALP
jgi:preprotein translocase subunit SecF